MVNTGEDTELYRRPRVGLPIHLALKGVRVPELVSGPDDKQLRDLSVPLADALVPVFSRAKKSRRYPSYPQSRRSNQQ